MKRKASGLFTRPRERLVRSRTDEDASRAAAMLELARARHHLDRARNHAPFTPLPKADPRAALLATAKAEIHAARALNRSTAPALIRASKELNRLERAGLISRSQVETAFTHLFGHTLRSRDQVKGESADPVWKVVRRARADLASAAALHRPSGPVITRATTELLALERAGVISAAESSTAFERIIAHYASTHDEVKGMSLHDIAVGADSDLPPELGSYSDGVTDSAVYHPEIIGCGMPTLAVSGALRDAAIGAGMSQYAVGAYHGLPSYLLTQKGLSNPVVRRRVAENIRAMTPKLRRRVLGRLRQAVRAARVSGVVSAYPTVAGSGVGWSGITVQGSRCPYANVAGALTP